MTQADQIADVKIAETEATAWPKPRVAWYGVGVLSVAYAFAILDRSVLSLLVQPIERDLGINDTQMGLLGGAAFGLFYATLGLPIGWLADRAE